MISPDCIKLPRTRTHRFPCFMGKFNRLPLISYQSYDIFCPLTQPQQLNLIITQTGLHFFIFNKYHSV